MNVYKDMLACWICGKEHDVEMYKRWEKEKRVYTCIYCGEQVISNSGKVMLKHVLANDKDSLIKEQ